jgi:tetratricopeptide (TPR) repeat protein
MHMLGTLYLTITDLAKAEPLLQRAITIREQVLGANHVDTTKSLNNLAIVYTQIDSFAKAEALHGKVAAIREASLGPEHPLSLDTLENLASLYSRTAGEEHRDTVEVIALFEQIMGPEHQRVAESLSGLGTLYRRTGAYGKAEAIQQRALMIYAKAFGPRHPMAAQRFANWDCCPGLMMAPDGALSLVPMAALQDPSGRYLVETFEITYPARHRARGAIGMRDGRGRGA